MDFGLNNERIQHTTNRAVSVTSKLDAVQCRTQDINFFYRGCRTLIQRIIVSLFYAPVTGQKLPLTINIVFHSFLELRIMTEKTKLKAKY